jgi:hypothetical protein
VFRIGPGGVSSRTLKLVLRIALATGGFAGRSR